MSAGNSTPKLPLDKKLQRFVEKIDSFSFENTSPTFAESELQESSSKDQEELPGQEVLTDRRSDDIQQESARINSPFPEYSNNVENPISEANLTTVRLRYGRDYLRPRYNSTPSTNNRCVELRSLHNINKSAKSVKMDTISNAVVNIIPLFSGEDTANLSNEIAVFITCCRLAYEALGAEEEKKILIKLLPTRLRGRALEQFCDKTFETIDEFFKSLKEHFSDEKSYINVNNELRLMQQQTGESLLSFLNRVKRQLEKCKQKAREQYPAGVNALQVELDELAVNSFKMGILNPNHKFYLLQDTEITLEALTPKIKRLQESEKYAFYPSLSSLHHSLLANPSSNSASLVTSQNYTNVNSNPYLNKTPENNTRFYKPENKVKCGFCNRLGHSYYDCRTRKSTPFCTQCRVYGHTYRTCQQNFNNFRSSVGNKNRPNNYQRNTYREVHMSHVNQAETQKSSECNFCLQSGHNENHCIAKERWEKRQLLEKIRVLEAENGLETTDDTPERL